VTAVLPFTAEQFFEVFGAYNNAIWPAQVVAYLAGLLAVALLYRPGAAADRVIAGVLACMWIWTGIVYHWYFFSTINAAAYFFGAAFVAQGVILLGAGVVRRNLQFGFAPGARAFVGIVFLCYAAIAYPLVGLAYGHCYPKMPWFGIAPCPVTIFTFGFVLLLERVCPWWIIAIPFLWSIVGGTAAFLLAVPQDWMLLASGVTTVALLMSGPARPLR
jgi:hypothetical protein